jgi:hypothetical protein
MTDAVNTDGSRTPYDHFPVLRQAYSEGFERAHVEVERLRAVIENAPHASDAEGRQRELLWREGFRRADQCTCWKSNAL